MRIIIHDLEERDFQRLFPRPLENTLVIASGAKIHHCLGCFGCWTKTPGACVIRDQYGDGGGLVKANAINMCRNVAGVSFSHGLAELEGRVS